MKEKKKRFRNILILGIVLISIIVLAFVMIYCIKKQDNNNMSNEDNSLVNKENDEFDLKSKELKENDEELNIENGLLISTEDIYLHDVDGKETNYVFTYCDCEFNAKYTKDNWKIYNSYLITNRLDMEIICKALIDIHPIHGIDKISYRTPEDMAYEWEQHNIAYVLIPKGSKWNNMAKDVDFNPSDQGKSLEEMYQLRVKK